MRCLGVYSWRLLMSTRACCKLLEQVRPRSARAAVCNIGFSSNGAHYELNMFIFHPSVSECHKKLVH